MDKVAFILYMIALVISPLLFGAVHAYAYTLVFLLIFVAGMLALIKGIKRERRKRIYRLYLLKSSLNPLLLVMGLFMLFQATPFPAGLIETLSPETWAIGNKAVPASDVTVTGRGVDSWLSLSPYFYPVRQSIIRFSVYGLLFFGLVKVLNSRKRIELAIFLILITGCLETLYGLIQTYSGSEHIWWFKKGMYIGDVTGTYINRNHFAGLMEMGLLLAAAFSASISKRNKTSKKGSGRKNSFKAKLSQFLSAEQQFNKKAFILFTGVVMGLGLIFSASRGGLISAAGAMLCMSLFLIFKKDHRRKGFILLLIFLITSIYAIHIGVDYTLGRFKTFESTFEARTRYALKTLEIFDDYKLTGIGVGNFQYAYPKYQAEEDKNIYIRFSHNDWAQLLAETGIVGLLLLLSGISFYVYQILRLWKKRSDPFAVCLGIAPLGAMAAMGVHSYSDFNLHIPANFLLLAAIMAIGYSALHLERHYGRERIHIHRYTFPMKYKGFVALFLLLGIIAWTGYWTVRHFMAEAYSNTVPNSTLNRDPMPPLGEIQQAIEWDRCNAEYWYKLALELIRIKNDPQTVRPEDGGRKAEGRERKTEDRGQWAEDGGRKTEDGRRRAEDGAVEVEDVGRLVEGTKEWLDGLLGESMVADYRLRLPVGARQWREDIKVIIVRVMEEAVRLNPFNAWYHLRTGWEYTFLWRHSDYNQKWLPAADISMDRAAYFAGVKTPRLHVEIGHYWVMRSKSVSWFDPIRKQAWEKACLHYKTALRVESGNSRKVLARQIVDYVWNYYPDPQYVEEIVE